VCVYYQISVCVCAHTHTHTRAEECNYQLLITNQLLIVFVTHRLCLVLLLALCALLLALVWHCAAPLACCLVLLLALVSVTMYTMKVYRYYPVTSDE